MQAIEFSTILESAGTIQLPLKVIKELKPGRDLKVIILYNDYRPKSFLMDMQTATIYMAICKCRNAQF